MADDGGSNDTKYDRHGRFSNEVNECVGGGDSDESPYDDDDDDNDIMMMVGLRVNTGPGADGGRGGWGTCWT